MALNILFYDSFDRWAQSWSGEWWSGINYSDLSLSAGNGRGSSTGMYITNTRAGPYKALGASYSEFYLGVAIRPTNTHSSTTYSPVMGVGTGPNDSAMLDICTNNTMAIIVRRNGATTVLGPSSATWTIGAWNYVELWVKLSTTVGEAKVWLNGTEILSGTGLNTGGASANYVGLSGGLGDAGGIGWNHYFDDFIVYDGVTVGGVPAPIGDTRIESQNMNANGSVNQWLGSDSDSTDNYLLVDEDTYDTNTWVGSGTVGQEDRYGFENTSISGGSIVAVATRAYARKTDTGTRKIKLQIASGANVSESPEITLAATGWAYTPFYAIPTKPGGGAWTVSDVNAAEVGVKVST